MENRYVSFFTETKTAKTISRDFLDNLDTLPKGLFVEDNPHRKPKERNDAR